MRSVRNAYRHFAGYKRGNLAVALSGSYILLIIGVRLFVEISVRLPDNDGLAGVWLFVVTMPLSWLVTLVAPDLAPTTFVWILTAAGLFQASMLYSAVRGKKITSKPES
jgi:hypothetical protein